jgi:hypothetical protein
MSIRILFSIAGAAALLLTSCVFDRPEPVWRKTGWTQPAIDRDLAVAHAEAEKSFPDAKPFEEKAKKPGEAEEMLEEARESVVHLWMTAHGWYYVRYDRRGRAIIAEV